jgi:uncharacterized protein (TIGR02246 family)
MHVILNPSDIKWGDAPPIFAPGAKMAVVQGDPSKAGVYTVRLKAGDGYKIPPHWHPTTENVTVISGTFNLGTGDSLDETTSTAMAAGAFASMPAKMHHYAWFKGDTEVQVHGVGPFKLTYVNRKDDPSKTGAKTVGKGEEKKPTAQESADTRVADEAAIRASNAEWVASAQGKDLEKAVSFYADDACFYPPAAPVATGKEAIRKSWSQLLAMPELDLRWSSSKVQVARCGDVAFESGSFVLSANNAQGKSETTTGNYVVAWKKQADGKWKVVEDMAHPNP